jgi:hypothetical protein
MPSPSATPPPSQTVVMSADRVAPRIAIKSPTAHRYRIGKTIVIKFTVTDTAGVASAKATIRRVGDKARTVKQGTKVHLRRAGTYVLRITARDRAGNATTKTVTFRVTRT